MASIKKLADGKYQIRAFKRNGRGSHRGNKTETFYGTEKEANLRGAEMDIEIETIVATNAPGSFAAFFDYWVAHLEKSGTMSKRTRKQYEQFIRTYALAELTGLKVGEINSDHIQDIYNGMRKRKLSKHTVRDVHKSLRLLFNFAISARQMKKTDVNPVLDTDGGKKPKKGEVEITILYPEMLSSFVAACEATEFGTALIFALETCMRPGEWTAIRWKDINWNLDGRRKTATVTVNQVIEWTTRPLSWAIVSSGKTDGSLRTIEISDDLRDRLIRHRREQNEHRLSSPVGYRSDLDLVFASPIGEPFRLGYLRKYALLPVRRLLEAQFEGRQFDLDGFNLYSLRHTGATCLLMRGVWMKAVSALLGHAKESTTSDYYSHLIPGATEVVVREMASLMYGPGPVPVPEPAATNVASIAR